MTTFFEMINVSSDMFDLKPSYHTLLDDNCDNSNEHIEIDFDDNSILICAEEEDTLCDLMMQLVQILMLNGVDDFNVKRPIVNELTL